MFHLQLRLVIFIFLLFPLANSIMHKCSYESPSPSEVIKSPRQLRSTRRPRHLPERFHIHPVMDSSVDKQPDYIIDHIKV